MADKEGFFPDVIPTVIPINIVEDWTAAVLEAFSEGGKFAAGIGQIAGDGIDYAEKVALPAADNFDGGEVLQAGALPDGLSGAAAELEHRANTALGFKKFAGAIKKFLASPAAINAAIEKGKDNLVALTATFASVGIRSMAIPAIAQTAAQFLANDQTWKTSAPKEARILTDDEDSCFDATLRRTAVAALTGLSTQGIVLVKTALKASIDQAVLLSAVAEFNARLTTTANTFATAGVTILYEIVVSPLAMHVKCSPTVTT